jgi:hypothetical protein
MMAQIKPLGVRPHAQRQDSSTVFIVPILDILTPLLQD